MVATREVRIRTKPLGRGPQAGDNPSGLIKFAHWAIEIVDGERNFLVELGVTLPFQSKVICTIGRDFGLFFPPGDVPYELRSQFAGSTSLDNDAIKKAAEDIIKTQPLYGTVAENCQRFATFLAYKIITSPTKQLEQRFATEWGVKIAAQLFPPVLPIKALIDGAQGIEQWARGLFS